MSTSDLLTLRMLAQRFKRYGLTIAWFRAEAEAERIPSFRAGRRLLFDAPGSCAEFPGAHIGRAALEAVRANVQGFGVG